MDEFCVYVLIIWLLSGHVCKWETDYFDHLDTTFRVVYCKVCERIKR